MFCNLELLPLGGSLFFPIFLSLIFLSNVFFPLWPSALKIFLPPSSACLTNYVTDLFRLDTAWTLKCFRRARHHEFNSPRRAFFPGTLEQLVSGSCLPSDRFTATGTYGVPALAGKMRLGY